jgi:hypothetical protein
MLTVITTKGYSVNSYDQIMETAEIIEYDREHQAVRLPKDFAFRGNQVYLKRWEILLFFCLTTILGKV